MIEAEQIERLARVNLVLGDGPPDQLLDESTVGLADPDQFKAIHTRRRAAQHRGRVGLRPADDVATRVAGRVERQRILDVLDLEAVASRIGLAISERYVPVEGATDQPEISLGADHGAIRVRTDHRLVVADDILVLARQDEFAGYPRSAQRRHIRGIEKRIAEVEDQRRVLRRGCADGVGTGKIGRRAAAHVSEQVLGIDPDIVGEIVAAKQVGDRAILLDTQDCPVCGIEERALIAPNRAAGSAGRNRRIGNARDHGVEHIARRIELERHAQPGQHRRGRRIGIRDIKEVGDRGSEEQVDVGAGVARKEFARGLNVRLEQLESQGVALGRRAAGNGRGEARDHRVGESGPRCTSRCARKGGGREGAKAGEVGHRTPVAGSDRGSRDEVGVARLVDQNLRTERRRQHGVLGIGRGDALKGRRQKRADIGVGLENRS